MSPYGGPPAPASLPFPSTTTHKPPEGSSVPPAGDVGRDLIPGSVEHGSGFDSASGHRTYDSRLIHEEGRVPLQTIAILVENEHHHAPASPCGSCRQLLNEYRQHQATPIKLLLASRNSKVVLEIEDVTDLLPLSFDGSFLGQ